MATLFYSPTDIARQFLYIREVPQNRGLRVESIQHWSGGQFGDSWCAEFAWMILDICFQGNSPIDRFQAVQSLYDIAKNNNWITGNPTKNDLFIYVDDNDHAHHIGIFTENGNGIAGNTSADGASSNGNMVAEHLLITNINHIKYINYPR